MHPVSLWLHDSPKRIRNGARLRKRLSRRPDMLPVLLWRLADRSWRVNNLLIRYTNSEHRLTDQSLTSICHPKGHSVASHLPALG